MEDTDFQGVYLCTVIVNSHVYTMENKPASHELLLEKIDATLEAKSLESLQIKNLQL